MSKYYLAVDIGASSGRHMLGWLEDGKICLEEVYRFKNSFSEKDGHLCWDIEGLFKSIKEGMKKCKEIGKIPSCMGIDTWGVDFLLIDKDGERIGDPIAYRDSRTEGMDEKVSEIISPEELYAKTGIQKLIFNSIYQLVAIKETNPESLNRAERFLMVPDYFNYLLTGNKANEYTNATTTQLVNAETKDWDKELIEKLGIDPKIFGEIHPAGSVLGNLSESMKDEIGYDLTVMLPPTHDTGSAVAAVPSNSDTVFLSSGTWSLLGVERRQAHCTEHSRELNYSNEGGYNYRFRFLKNIMGLWMIQCVKRELNDKYSFPEMAKLAKENEIFKSRVDVNDDKFLAPLSMIEAVKEYCEETRQEVPENIGQVLSVIYQSLADCYAKAVSEIESLMGKTYPCMNIVGGGCQDNYLNELTARATGKKLFAGPVEATATGNVIIQMIGQGDIESLRDARDIIAHSFHINEY